MDTIESEDNQRPRRRWYQFRIRTLLIVTTVCAIAFGYFSHQARVRRAAIEAIRQLEQAGAIFVYRDDVAPTDSPHENITEISLIDGDEDFALAIPFLWKIPHSKTIVLDLQPSDVKLLKHYARHAEVLKKFKAVRLAMDFESPMSDVQFCYLSKISNLQAFGTSSYNRRDVTDVGLACLSDLVNLQTLHVSNTRITDAGLIHLKNLKKLDRLLLMMSDITGEGIQHLVDLPLQTLYVGGIIENKGLNHIGRLEDLRELGLIECPNVTGAGIKSLCSLKNLQELALNGTRIDDSSIVYFLDMPGLRKLTISNTDSITDAAVETLSQLTQLEKLSLYHTQISEEGIAKIRQALPDTDVQYIGKE